MEIICPDKIIKAIALLEQNGFSAYAVGGCVRDALTGTKPNDRDMTTSASPEEIQRVFSAFKTVPTGIKHGTVTVIIDREPVEITTMRVDGKYSDNRRPESVLFTDKIEEDLSRRDFTVNAMAFNPKTGLIDPYGGAEDIKKRVLRCVGNPDMRFNEDALRILRAVRFSSTLGFDICAETSESIFKNLGLLSNISMERIRTELIKLLCGKNVEAVLTEYREVIFSIIPELAPTYNMPQNSPYHIYDVWTHTIKVTASIEPKSDYRVAALLHDIEKPSMRKTDENGTDHFKGHPEKGAQTAEKILRRLRFSNAEIHHITTVIRLHDNRPDGNRFHLAEYCAEHGIDNVEDTLKIIIADAYGKNPDYFDEAVGNCSTALKQIAQLRHSGACLSTAELDINGNDIMDLGIERIKIKEALNYLLKEVINERITNKKTALLKAAEKFKLSQP